MRDKVYSLFPSFYFLVSGLLVLLRFAGNLQISETEIFGIVFLVTSPVYLYFSFGRKLKGGLISATFLFLLGVVFLVVKQWEILNLLQVVLPSVFFIPGGTDPKGLMCRIRVRCWDVKRLGVKLNIHCGVEVESDVPPFNKGTGPIVSVDGTDAGDHIGVVFADPAVEEGLQDLPGERTDDWEEYEDGVCKCLALRGKLFRQFKVPYENLANETGPDGKPIANPTNSNFAFKCITKSCGIKVPDWAKMAYGYNSVYRRQCGVWVDDAGCRRCVETVAECPWDVPVIVSVR